METPSNDFTVPAHARAIGAFFKQGEINDTILADVIEAAVTQTEETWGTELWKVMRVDAARVQSSETISSYANLRVCNMLLKAVGTGEEVEWLHVAHYPFASSLVETAALEFGATLEEADDPEEALVEYHQICAEQGMNMLDFDLLRKLFQAIEERYQPFQWLISTPLQPDASTLDKLVLLAVLPNEDGLLLHYDNHAVQQVRQQLQRMLDSNGLRAH